MGYTTEFEGQIEIVPPLPFGLITYINDFCNVRHMKRDSKKLINQFGGNMGFGGNYGVDGEFFIGGKGFAGQDNDDTILEYNYPPDTQPGLWCDWEITEDGRFIQWNGAEKFYDSDEWMAYLINNFIPKEHECNGIIHAFGEDRYDVWDLVVENNKVRVALQ